MGDGEGNPPKIPACWKCGKLGHAPQECLFAKYNHPDVDVNNPFPRKFTDAQGLVRRFKSLLHDRTLAGPLWPTPPEIQAVVDATKLRHQQKPQTASPAANTAQTGRGA